jgi:hypothetical protein
MMLKILETTPNRLVIKEERSICDVMMLGVFIYDATYLLLISTLNMWSKVGIEESFLKSIYDIMTHPPLVFFNAIGLFLFPAALGSLLTFGSWFPTRTFTFDRKNNLLTIEFHCLFWHHEIEYSLSEIQSLQWLPQSVYVGGTMVDAQFLKLIRRKQNGKTHLIPVRYTNRQETSTTVDLIHRFLVSRN